MRPFTVKSGTGKTHTLGLALAACQRRLSVGLSTAATVVHEPMTVDGAHPETVAPNHPPKTVGNPFT